MGERALSYEEAAARAEQDPAAMVCARCHFPYGVFLRDPLTGRAVHADGCPPREAEGGHQAPLSRLAPHPDAHPGPAGVE